MKNPETFCESVLNAIHASDPFTVNDSNIVYACYLLSGFYCDLAKKRGMNKEYREWRCKENDFWDQFVELRGMYRKKLKESGMRGADAQEKAEKVFNLKKSTIESHFNSEYGCFQFNHITFG